ncbi:unnamed protein product [Didymodactylos carnosus]|uniref:HAT C-terminal dimerisation domain-containing protein n=1 Tax=Didymodactylos carnosus TaxID=1234261 RepID=A0A8S2JI16_9BILA|nr:unnamed protein product [Didymodactylos carnosus]CAF3810404.1 unnamed protein product [Didymodactylos carnosus]
MVYVRDCDRWSLSDLRQRISFEFSKKSTLQTVIPSYYLIKQYCIVNNKHDKYWTLTTSLHWIATYLDPSFKELSFVNDRKFFDDQKKCIIDGLLVLTEDLKDFPTPTAITDSSLSSSLSSTATTVATTTFTPPLKKIKKNDPFATKIAKSIYVTQASSAESERHFSTSGQIVTEQRLQLDLEYVESLVVLKEAYLNNNWPKK